MPFPAKIIYVECFLNYLFVCLFVFLEAFIEGWMSIPSKKTIFSVGPLILKSNLFWNYFLAIDIAPGIFVKKIIKVSLKILNIFCDESFKKGDLKKIINVAIPFDKDLEKSPKINEHTPTFILNCSIVLLVGIIHLLTLK